MRHSLTRTVLLASVCIFAHGAIRAWCETNETASGENTNETTWTVSKEGREIEESIAKAPEVILSLTNDVREYTAMICEKIKKSPIPETRYRYFRKLMESACGVDFETIEKNVPEEKVEQPRWFSGPGDRREYEIARQLGELDGQLRELANDISDALALSSVPAPCVELFEPYFKLIERLKAEEQWLGKSKSLCFIKKYIQEKIESVAGHIEFRFRRVYSVYSQPLRTPPDPQDLALCKARFKQVVGRPMRSAEEYRADSRRRMDEIIRRRKEGR